MIRVDMSEYMERHTVARLIGAPPGYVGYEEGGQLTERVRRRPFSVILLDEIEKAHPDVHNVLLQVFDDGRLTDGKGRVVDFTNTLIIATSNIGAEIIARRLRQEGGEAADPAKVREELMETLRMHFRPEFINRLDEVIVFHSLTREQIKQIVRMHLERVRRTAHAQGVELEIDESLVDYMASEGYRPEYGARELKRLIRSTLETELARTMLSDEVHEGDRVKARWDAARQKLLLEPQGRAQGEPGGRPSRKPRKTNGATAAAPPPQTPPVEPPQPQAGA
jgi:ATP-dependent Clp protease ATP-binding subunit ClpC